MLDRKLLEEALEWVESDNAIAANLGPLPEHFKFSISIFDRVASTNQTVWELVALGAPPGTIAIAREQTAGRGQRGRHWQSQIGGLYLSMAVAPNLAAVNAGALTMAVAWAIATGLRSVGIPVLLKWPNDLILAKRKLGGILTETRVRQGRVAKAVIGVGINWSNPVPETGINLESFLADLPKDSPSNLASDLPAGEGTGELLSLENLPLEKLALEKSALENLSLEKLSLEKLAAIVAWAIAVGTAVVGREDGIETLVLSYQELLANMGQTVAIEGRQGKICGVAKTGDIRVSIDPKVNLRQKQNNNLDTSDVLKEIYLKPGTISLGYENPQE
ncbi:MAG: biotin--[acetyl-CoA-carboxylase] ligase [Oscillatoria sp. SIO1A7]|nr:biotin--[acetyl-CoA-carboxylase] ligase [Oscillatoria sp. SIO1A7]